MISKNVIIYTCNIHPNMTLTQAQKDKIVTLLKVGESPTSIAKIVKVSKSSVYNVIHETGITKEAGKKNLKATEKDPTEEEKNGEAAPEEPDGEIPEESDAENEDESKENIDQKIVGKTVDEYIRKASAELSSMLKDDLVLSLNAGAILRREEMMHRAEIEEVGLKWEEYIQWCLETGYSIFQRVLIAKVQEEEIAQRKITPEKLVEAKIIGKMGRL